MQWAAAAALARRHPPGRLVEIERSAQECCPTPPQAPEQRTATLLIAHCNLPAAPYAHSQPPTLGQCHHGRRRDRADQAMEKHGHTCRGRVVVDRPIIAVMHDAASTVEPRVPKGEQLLRKACLIFHGVCACKTSKRLSRDAIGLCKSIPEPRTRQNGARTARPRKLAGERVLGNETFRGA
jgi:hypothetical protein